MRLNKDYIVYDMSGDTCLVPVGEAAKAYRGIVRCNATAAFALECLKEDTSEEAVLAKFREKYEGDPEQMKASLAKTLDTLRSIGALVE